MVKRTQWKNQYVIASFSINCYSCGLNLLFPNLLQKELKDCFCKEAEMKIKAAIGFRHVIDLLSSEKKLIVGHNSFLGMTKQEICPSIISVFHFWFRLKALSIWYRYCTYIPKIHWSSSFDCQRVCYLYPEVLPLHSRYKGAAECKHCLSKNFEEE